MTKYYSFFHSFLVYSYIVSSGIWQTSVLADLLHLLGQARPADPDLLLEHLIGQAVVLLLLYGQHQKNLLLKDTEYIGLPRGDL